MDEAGPMDTASLKHLAETCASYLLKLSQDELAKKVGGEKRDGFWALRQSAELNMWCTKVGVFGEGSRSLDVRLKDVPEICERLKLLLESLECDLNELQLPFDDRAQSGNEYDSPDDVGSDASSLSFTSLSSSEGSKTGNATHDAMSPSEKRHLSLRSHIEDTIDRLQEHARHIERAGAQHRRERVEIYLQKERPKQVYEGFKKLGLWKANDTFKNATDEIKDRTAESFARRRIRFEYLKEHERKKRAVDSKDPRITRQYPQPDLGTVQNAQTHGNIGQTTVVNSSSAPYPEDLQTIFSATVHTRLDFRSAPKRKERAESVRSVALANAGLPPPPQTHNGRFQCPYCLLGLRAKETEKSRWSQHVMLDFEPYFCTFGECQAPFDVPNSFDGLLDHMQGHLPVRHHIDAPDGEHMEFVETEFEDHLKSHGEISADIMATMKETSRRKGAFLFEDCPFCGGYPDVLDTQFPDPHTIDAQKELRKHIKQHMQEIALFLPPYRSDIFNEEDDIKGSDATHRQSAHEEVSGNPDDFVVVCDQEDCECKISNDDSTGVSTAEPETSLSEEFWSDLFHNSDLYDRSKASNTDLANDECLYSFVMLFIAQKLGNIEFYEHWTRFTTKDGVGCSPMKFAITNYSGDAAQGLMNVVENLGFNLDTRDTDSLTPLMIAAMCNNVTMLELLRGRGAELELYDKEGRTALSLAAASGCLDAVKCLVRIGADMQTQDNTGQTPLSLALRGQHGFIAKLLQLSLTVGSQHDTMAQFTRSGDNIDADTFGISLTPYSRDQYDTDAEKEKRGSSDCLFCQWYDEAEPLDDSTLRRVQDQTREEEQWSCPYCQRSIILESGARPSFVSPEERLTAFFDVSQLRGVFSVSETEKMANLLLRTGQDGYISPRWYIVLRIIGKLELLPRLLGDAQLRDEWFPIDQHYLPNDLDTEVKASILEHQHVVLTFPDDWEDGKFRHFNTNTAKPFFVLRNLCSGSWGIVEVIESKTTLERYALKWFRRSLDTTKRLISEISTLKRLQHGHLVRYVCSYTDTIHLGLVMSPVADCSLLFYLEEASTIASMRPTLQRFFGCLAAGLSYLHEQHIRHDAMEPQNILVCQNQVFLAGFGFSYRFSVPESEKISLRYLSPEVASYGPRRTSSDIWSLGCVFLEMVAALRGLGLDLLESHYKHWEKGSGSISGSFTYCDNIKTTSKLLESWKPLSWNEGEKAPVVWIESMLQVDTQTRPTAAQVLTMILDHPGYSGSCCESPRTDMSDSESDHSMISQRASTLTDRDPRALIKEEEQPELMEPMAPTAQSSGSTDLQELEAHSELVDILPPLLYPFRIQELQTTPTMHDQNVLTMSWTEAVRGTFAAEVEAGRFNQTQLRATLESVWGVKFQPHTLSLMLRVFGSSNGPESIDRDQYCDLDLFIRTLLNTRSRHLVDREYGYPQFKEIFNLPDECVQLLFNSFDQPSTNYLSLDGLFQACLSVRLLDGLFKLHEQDQTGYAQIPFEAFLSATVTTQDSRRDADDDMIKDAPSQSSDTPSRIKDATASKVYPHNDRSLSLADLFPDEASLQVDRTGPPPLPTQDTTPPETTEPGDQATGHQSSNLLEDTGANPLLQRLLTQEGRNKTHQQQGAQIRRAEQKKGRGELREAVENANLLAHSFMGGITGGGRPQTEELKGQQPPPMHHTEDPKSIDFNYRAADDKSSLGSKKDRAVGFLKDPVDAVRRPVNVGESWATYDFEVHAQNCVYCKDPYEVHRNHEALCQIGHRLAQDVAALLYNRADGITYSTSEEDHKLVQVEIPAGYPNTQGVLKAIERSLRHRSRIPFVS